MNLTLLVLTRHLPASSAHNALDYGFLVVNLFLGESYIKINIPNLFAVVVDMKVLGLSIVTSIVYFLDFAILKLLS